MEWWHSGQYFCLPITRSVVQFPLRTLIYALSSSYIYSYIVVVVRMSILDTKVAGSNLSINIFSP